MRVLLIEDHKPLVRALRQGLEEEGFAVDVAFDGDEADHKAIGTNCYNYFILLLEYLAHVNYTSVMFHIIRTFRE